MRRLVVAAVLLLLASGALRAEDPAALDQLNATARGAYADGRAAFIARTSPVIVVAFDELVLLRDGKETREGFTPAAYHQLKSVSHVPLGVVALLSSRTAGERDGPWRARLEDLRDKARAARSAVDQLAFSPAQKTRLQRILSESLAKIDGALALGVPDAATLTEFARAVAPLLLANADDAARLQLDGLHALAQRWRQELTPEEWHRLYVLVLGGKLPRAGNLQYAYFVEALGPGSADRRVIYAEGIFDQAGALALLATIVTDRRAGVAFFADETRLERDLLSDAAQAYLLRQFGRLGSD